jgi:small GTP-binding protein
MSSIMLRAPICGIFGHVDSGKTSFLSKLKSFEIVEAGDITQGISSVFIPIDKIKSMCEKIIDLKELFNQKKDKDTDFEIKIPGILFIDTPGHEAFSNFRKKAADICDFAIVIIDIQKGVEPQAVESIQMLTSKRIPFIVVLTKLDKVNEWKIIDTSNLKQSLKIQNQDTIIQLNMLMEDIKFELSKSQIIAEFYFKNKTPRKIVSMIPISNKSGEGFNDLINYLIFIIQNFMENRLTIVSKLNAIVIDKSFDKNLGWTINIILASGTLKTGDNIIISTQNGPIKSVIRNMIGIQYDNLKQKFIRSNYSNQTASCAITLFAPNLENIIIGSHIFIYNSEIEYNDICSKIESCDIKENFISKIKKESHAAKQLGFYLFTSSEDEFEAGYQVFKTNNIPIINGSYGPLTEKEIDMFEVNMNNLIKNHNLDNELTCVSFAKQKPQGESSVSFVKQKPQGESSVSFVKQKPQDDACKKYYQENLLEYKIMIYYTSQDKKPNNFEKLIAYAKNKNISLIFNDVIYKLLDDFTNLKNNIISSRQNLYISKGFVMIPVELKVLKQHIYLQGGSDDFLIGFKVIEGTLFVGTQIICIKSNKQIINLGYVTSIEKIKEKVESASKNTEVCVKLNNPEHYSWLKDFNEKDIFITNMTRKSLELLKRDFKSKLLKDDWILTIKIVKLLMI